jgi:hypothetical protein
MSLYAPGVRIEVQAGTPRVLCMEQVNFEHTYKEAQTSDCLIPYLFYDFP